MNILIDFSKSPERVLQCRLRLGICLILVVCFSVYATLLDGGIETRAIDCSIGVVVVHTLVVTGKKQIVNGYNYCKVKAMDFKSCSEGTLVTALSCVCPHSFYQSVEGVYSKP